MSGFVGARARKKRRNIFFILALFIIIGIFFYYFPKLEVNNTEIIPNDNIIPDPTKDMTSLLSNIEELELSLFQKDQKIKFRDGQIKNLQNKLQETKSQYDVLTIELSQIKNDFDTLLSNNDNLVASDIYKTLQNKFTKLNTENDNNISKIKKLNKIIEELTASLKSLDDETDYFKIENQKLKKDNKSFVAKNLKIENNITELKEKINKQKNEIDFYLEQIKKLKDKSHHGR